MDAHSPAAITDSINAMLDQLTPRSGRRILELGRLSLEEQVALLGGQLEPESIGVELTGPLEALNHEDDGDYMFSPREDG